MIDSITQEPIAVYKDGDAGPYVMVPVDQLDKISALLRNNNIPFWVDSDAISLNGQPEITVINFARDVDVTRIQRLLNEAE